MNKQILLMMSIFIMLSVFTIADNDDTNTSISTSNSGSFEIKEDKTLLGLTSNYKGQGWGCGYVHSLKIPFFKGYMTFFEIHIKGFQKQTQFFHVKKLNMPREYPYFSQSFQSFEFLNTLDDREMISYKLSFRIPVTMLTENTRLIHESDDNNLTIYSISNIRCNKYVCDFITYVERKGIYTIGTLV